jgi:hypothetical protein
VEPAQKAVDFDPTNEKAWRRLALGHAARKEFGDALSTLDKLEELAERSTTDAEVVQWRADWARLKDVKAHEVEEREADEYDIAASNQKEKFDMVCAKYGLQNDEMAGEIADMIVRDGVMKAEKLANIYHMDEDDAEWVLAWIQYMLKVQAETEEVFGDQNPFALGGKK